MPDPDEFGPLPLPRALFAPPPGLARHDYDIFADLAEASGCGGAYTEGRDAQGWLRRFLEDSEVPDPDEFRRSGIHWGGEQERVGLADFAADPVGSPLATPSGRVELSGGVCASAGLSKTPEARVLLPSPERPLYFISPKSRLRVHTQFADIPWIRERDDRTLWIHPADASARGIVGDDEVVVASDRGSVRCFCRVTEGVMEGVVSLLAGIEPRFAEDGCDTAGSANVLTSPEPTLPSRGARLLSTLVEVRRAGPQAGSGAPSARPDPG